MARIIDTPSQRKPALTPKAPRQFDLNTDFGQTADRSFFDGKERSLLNYVSSVNIPCCVHDSDPAQVLKDIQTARSKNCSIGAHIAYPDPVNYGYTASDMDAETLYAWVLLQLGAFSSLARANKVDITHVRPHGALYAKCMMDESVAVAVAKAIQQFDPWLTFIAPLSPVMTEVQSQIKLPIATEIYLGKRFRADGTLNMERFKDSLHPQGVVEQVKQLVTDSSITTEDGKILKVNCRTLHLSPKLQGSMMMAERLPSIMGQPVAIALSAAHNSGWA